MNQNQNWAAALQGTATIEELLAMRKPATPTRKLGKLPQMHVGRGQRYGNLTWFPIFTDAPVAPRNYVTQTAAGNVHIDEQANPNVGCLEVKNELDQPVLLFEGALIEGGWQDRALTRTVLVNAKTTTQIPVVCVEAGRWGGNKVQRFAAKQAPANVRRALRGIQKNAQGVTVQHFADQSAVWAEVDKFATKFAASQATNTLAGALDDVAAKIAAEPKPEPLFGQRGVLIAIGGHPLALEVFDHPDTFAERFATILDAYVFDAAAAPFVECKSQFARDFVERIEKLGVEPTDQRNYFRNKADKYVATEAVTTEAGNFLHLATLNAQHELVLAA